MPGHRLSCTVGSEGTNTWWVRLWGQHLCASLVVLTGRTGCVGMENAPLSQGCKPLQKVFSGRATIEKSSKENMSTNKPHKKVNSCKNTQPRQCPQASWSRWSRLCHHRLPVAALLLPSETEHYFVRGHLKISVDVSSQQVDSATLQVLSVKGCNIPPGRSTPWTKPSSSFTCCRMFSMLAVPTSGLRAMEILPDVVGTVTTKTSLTDKANGEE